MNVQNALAEHIRAWCKRNEVALTEQSKNMGKYEKYLTKMCDSRSTMTEKNIELIHRNMAMPCWLYQSAMREARALTIRRGINISKGKRRRVHTGLHPWPVTVQKAKQGAMPWATRAWA